jgi:hypothetical protein
LAYGYFRRTGTLDYGLAAAGRKRRRWNRLFNLGILVLAVATILAALRTERLGLTLVIVSLPLVAASIASARSRLFRVVKIDRQFMQIELTTPAAHALARLA